MTLSKLLIRWHVINGVGYTYGGMICGEKGGEDNMSLIGFWSGKTREQHEHVLKINHKV